MKITSPFLHKLGGLLVSGVVRAWMDTVEVRSLSYDPGADPARSQLDPPYLYVFWHEYLLLPLHARGHCHLTMLVSQHRDAAVLTRMADHLGFGVVRGSTRRGGLAALRELLRAGRRRHLAITPDGPRGPRRHLASGAIYVSSRLGVPIVPIGFGYDRPWRLKSWDRFAIPRPFSQVRAILGPPMSVPAGLDRSGIEHYRREVQRLLDRLTAEAEGWATSGSRKPGERADGRQVARLRRAA